MKLLTLALISFIFLTGCNKEDEEDTSFVRSCDAYGYCIDYIGSKFSDSNVASLNCDAHTPSEYINGQSCLSTDSVGTCTVKDETEDETLWTYYSERYSAATAEADCTDRSGLFTAN